VNQIQSLEIKRIPILKKSGKCQKSGAEGAFKALFSGVAPENRR
jgi:hypothetical protein